MSEETFEMNEVYAQIRDAMEKAMKASDAWYEETYRTGIITDQSNVAREFMALCKELRDVKKKANWIK